MWTLNMASASRLVVGHKRESTIRISYIPQIKFEPKPYKNNNYFLRTTKPLKICMQKKL